MVTSEALAVALIICYETFLFLPCLTAAIHEADPFLVFSNTACDQTADSRMQKVGCSGRGLVGSTSRLSVPQPVQSAVAGLQGTVPFWPNDCYRRMACPYRGKR